MNYSEVKKLFKNFENYVKEAKIDLGAYDFKFIGDGFNCELTWNPKYHKMPLEEKSIDHFTGKEKTVYITYIQLSSKCSSMCHSSGTISKELVLERLKNTRRNEMLEMLNDESWSAEKEGLHLFAISYFGETFGFLKAKELKMDFDKSQALIVGGKWDGYTIMTQGFYTLKGQSSEFKKYLATKRWAHIEVVSKKDKLLSVGR